MKCLRFHLRDLSAKQTGLLVGYCRHSNSLYNCSLYIVKSHFEETGEYLNYNKVYHLIKSHEHFKALPAKIACLIVKLVDQDFRSFFKLLKQKQKGMYANPVKPPHYKKSGELFSLVCSNQQVTVNESKGILKITKDIKLPFTYKIDGQIKQAIIKPLLNGKYFEINIAYEKNEIEQIKTKEDHIMSIDLGLNNLATCYSNVGRDIIVNGKPLKAYNQFYNKRKAKMQSELERCNKTKYSQKLRKVDINRKNFVSNYMNQSVARITSEVIGQQISKVVIGYNEGWKNGINIGKKNNQNFVSVPHATFTQKLKNKLEEIGVDVIFHEESYTSKCSALDMEPIKKQEKYSGRRVKRGLFKSSKGDLINADLNGAINIMRKVIPDAICFAKGIERCRVHPKMLQIL